MQFSLQKVSNLHHKNFLCLLVGLHFSEFSLKIVFSDIIVLVQLVMIVTMCECAVCGIDVTC